ncbi:MAG: acetylornithine deacetylase/succinyl-diaminopimelate desuccinylase family protein [Acidobacteria bacterium]|nr:acetylornithine deacetylase/succinyl-diaminopimelate desuccinylase family protein [Acidobacteriota bacterium]
MTSASSGLGLVDRVLSEAAVCGEEVIRVPSVNPPGDAYRECAELLGVRLEADGFETEYIQGPGSDPQRPKINVLGLRRGRSARPALHLNGHIDVVPPGDGWTVDPFGGEIRDGWLYGRGSADMKAGIAAAVFAAEAVRRSGVSLHGTLEISGTVDEESGGHAGVAHLAQIGRITSRTTDYVIIPEPFSPTRICIGHRGVLWFRILVRGRIAHGSMPFLGVSAIDAAAEVALGLREALGDLVTELPVVPEGARRPTLNVNSIAGGQVIEGLGASGDGASQGLPSPCVADECELVVDRRYLLEEGADTVRTQVREVLSGVESRRPGVRFEVEEVLSVEPTSTPDDCRLVESLSRGIEAATGQPADLVASPGTYDHKHFQRIGGIGQCVAYGPGELEQAHQPDERCALSDITRTTQALALTIVDLLS